MSAAKSLKTYYHRFLGLGWARVFLILGAIFIVLALLSPMWAYLTPGPGGSSFTFTFGWTTVTRMRYEGGAWAETLIQSYNAQGFDFHAIANSVSVSYVLLLVFLIVLIVVAALFSLQWVHRLPALGLLIIALIVVAIGLVALFYPVATVPAAAASDLGDTAITGYWGSAGVDSWGAGLGWWFVLVGVILGGLGGAWPFLRGMRHPLPPPPPQQYQIEP